MTTRVRALISRFCVVAAIVMSYSLTYAQENRLTLQLESLNSQDAASTSVAKLQTNGIKAYIAKVTLPSERVLFHVRVGRFESKDEAIKYGEQLRSAGLAKDYLITEYEGEFDTQEANIGDSPSAPDATPVKHSMTAPEQQGRN